MPKFIELLTKIQIPSSMETKLNSSGVREICLSSEMLNGNMQTDDAAFEGWALLFHSIEKKKILLDIDRAPSKNDNHYNRFLYRVMKFNKQFPDWFKISSQLRKGVNEFEAIISSETSGKFENNDPGDESKLTDKGERGIESKLSTVYGTKLLKELAATKGIDLGKNQIYRQLPVGLFKGEKRGNSYFFPGKGADIDLWTFNGDAIYIFELKYSNRKVGLLSELYFYANYMHDMYAGGNSHFIRRTANNNSLRGYDKISNASIKQIYAIALVDEFHPNLDDQKCKIFKLLNQNESLIKYDYLIYNPNDLNK
ncbi:MAG TPA: hypothetical protein PK854_12260 [Oscillospiraceae bacterium]|nr:hypothetical protein [Oscillospiraceae bacterium]HPS36023.1 hypothetical protein [Oscillospiraceae bacterium]